ncbi:MAG: hypothetical protein NZ851_02490, partial [Aquificaceae bacterium]|nr:hypothetical protein [Aquificaceae bacterium]
LKSILDYSVEMEERSETLLGAENPEEDETLIKLEKLTGIDRQKLLYIIRSALDTLETMLKV